MIIPTPGTLIFELPLVYNYSAHSSESPMHCFRPSPTRFFISRYFPRFTMQQAWYRFMNAPAQVKVYLSSYNFRSFPSLRLKSNFQQFWKCNFSKDYQTYQNIRIMKSEIFQDICSLQIFVLFLLLFLECIEI